MTKHYKKPDGSVWGFEDDQLHLVSEDMTEMTAIEVSAFKSPTPTEGELLAQFTAAIQARLDAFAQSRNYDGILSACSYAASGNAKFAAEGAYCVAVRDATWAKGYEILTAVRTGLRDMPTLQEVAAELPTLGWPV